MVINESTIDTLSKLFQNGNISASQYVSMLFKSAATNLRDTIIGAFGDILPAALLVAGAVLVVALGWRLFRNFTRG